MVIHLWSCSKYRRGGPRYRELTQYRWVPLPIVVPVTKNERYFEVSLISCLYRCYITISPIYHCITYNRYGGRYMRYITELRLLHFFRQKKKSLSVKVSCISWKVKSKLFPQTVNLWIKEKSQKHLCVD